MEPRITYEAQILKHLREEGGAITETLHKISPHFRKCIQKLRQKGLGIVSRRLPGSPQYVFALMKDDEGVVIKYKTGHYHVTHMEANLLDVVSRHKVTETYGIADRNWYGNQKSKTMWQKTKEFFANIF